MDYEQILFEQRGTVGLITLNRPERLNAWTDRMQQEMRDAVERCNSDDSIGAIVFTGARRVLRRLQLFIDNALDGDIDAVMRREGEALAKARESDEHKEAVRAFMEKRQPVFRR